MVVQHNITAMNSNRMLNVTTGAQAKSTEKLSSGYKINRAADDAAGLSISEKMRRQIRGLTQASTNAQDGISSVQTAEGALGEIHDMLQRMDELATKAANGTLSKGDRQNVQDEIDSLLTEIDRVSETTKFNEIYLLKGEKDGAQSAHTVNAHDAGLEGKLEGVGSGTATFSMDALENGAKISIAGKNYVIGETVESSFGDDITSLWTEKKDGEAESSNAGLTLKDDDVAANTTLDGTFTYKAAADETATFTGTGKLFKYEYDSTNGFVSTEVDTTDADEVLAAYNAISAGNDIGSAAGTAGEVYYVVADSDPGTKATTTAMQGLSSSAASATDDFEHTDAITAGWYDAEDTINTDVADLIDNGTPAAGDTITLTKGAEAEKITDPANLESGKKYFKDAANTEAATEGKDYILGSEPDAEAISAEEAYGLIKNELKTASSIGTDTEASVADAAVADGKAVFTITEGSVNHKDSLQFNLHVGADADMTNKIGVKIDAMNTSNLGIKKLDVVDDTGIKATYAIDSIEDAIKKVSNQRSALGAVQNRLEHTVKNLDNIVENTTSAESEIRDTDMATEMVTYSKNNILAQAGQSMLAQANQSNQGVLSLLG